MATSNQPAPLMIDDTDPGKGWGQRLQPLYQEALREIEPILKGTGNIPPTTRLYQAMELLHRHYSHLSGVEIETLLSDLLRRRPTWGVQ